MKSLCPGESRKTILLSPSSIFLTPTSMVTPRFLYSSVESVTQACLKDYFPISFDYFQFLCTYFLSRKAASFRKIPTRVDFPESTCPTTTILIVLLGTKSLATLNDGYQVLQWSVKYSSTTYELLRTFRMGSSSELLRCINYSTLDFLLSAYIQRYFSLISCSCFYFSLRFAYFSSFSLAFLSSFSFSFCLFFLSLSTVLSKSKPSAYKSLMEVLQSRLNIYFRVSILSQSSEQILKVPGLKSLSQSSEYSLSSLSYYRPSFTKFRMFWCRLISKNSL